MPIACARCVLPKPELPYISNGLNGFLPGALATANPAERAKRLHSPSTKFAKVLSGLSCGSTCNFLIPGIINGFLILCSRSLDGMLTGLFRNSVLFWVGKTTVTGLLLVIPLFSITTLYSSFAPGPSSFLRVLRRMSINCSSRYS